MRGERTTRTDRLLALLLIRKGQPVALPEVQRAAGAQHGARFAELRERGYVIENVMDRVNGQTRSWYVMRAEPGETAPLFRIPPPPPQTQIAEDCSRDEAARMRRRS